MVRGSYRGQDGLSSVRLVVDEDGDVVASYDADEFGNPFTPGGSDPTITDQRWVGGLGYKDEVAATGLYYVRQRYYDPMLGRWLSRDPIGIRGGLNLYQYSFSNPMNFVDPSGLNVYLWAREQQGPTDVGHVWIEVDDPNSPGGRYSIGAYAGPGLQSPDPGCGERTAQGSNEVSPGVIKDASGQRFFLLKTYVTTPDEDQRMIAFLNQHLQESHKNPGSNNPYYNLVIDTKTRTLDINKTKVCTTVATSFLKKTFDPNAPTTIIQPNNLILHYLPTADVKPGPMPGVPK